MFYIVIGAIRLADKWLVDSGLKLGCIPGTCSKDACLAITLTLSILSIYNIFCEIALK